MEMFLLLQECGVPVDLNDWVPAAEKTVQGGMHPIRMERGVPVFTSEQLSLFGSPEHFGYDQYEVIQLSETESPLVSDWKFEQQRDKLRPIHRYNRVERFEFILMQLLGLRGEVPEHVLAVVMQYADKSPEKAWNSIRAILKHYRHRKYYNRIPFIMHKMGLGSVFSWDGQDATYRDIVNDFKKLQHVFEYCQKRQQWKRSYFPSLKFIAIKLLEKHGATCNFNIQFIRTKRRHKLLNDIWSDFQ